MQIAHLLNEDERGESLVPIDFQRSGFGELLLASMDAVDKQIKGIHSKIQLENGEERKRKEERERDRVWFRNNAAVVTNMEIYQRYIDCSHLPTTLISSRWTTIEHGLFIVGLYVFGRGAQDKISEVFLPGLSASQISYHAQKYFERVEKSYLGIPRGRKSIHDMCYYWHENGVIERYFVSPYENNPGQLSISSSTNTATTTKITKCPNYTKLPLHVSIQSLANENLLKTNRAALTAKLYNKDFPE